MTFQFRLISTHLHWMTQDGMLCGVIHRVNETEKHKSRDCTYHTCAYHASGCRFYGKVQDVEQHQRLYCASIHARIAKLEAIVAEDTLIAETKRINRLVEKKVSS